MFRTIKGYPVRLDFVIKRAKDLRAVHICDLRTKEPLAQRPMTPTFDEAIEAYPWAATIAALVLT
jgi:hypothetical protein